MGRRNVKNGANKRSCLTKIRKEISTIVDTSIDMSDSKHPINTCCGLDEASQKGKVEFNY